jgi:hypothetical protein
VLFFITGVDQHNINEHYNELIQAIHEKKIFIKFMKYDGAFVSPNGITKNSYKPY